MYRDPGWEPDPLPEEPTTLDLLEKIVARLEAIEITLGDIWRMKQAAAPRVPGKLPQPGDPDYDDVPF